MQINLSSIREDKPGPKWQNLFETYWPAYKQWFMSRDQYARPDAASSARQLRRHMPELAPVYERLVELAGGGAVASRFLSFYCPPPYVFGCSQAVFNRQEPVLVRNYDYSPALFEGSLLYTSYNRPVIAMGDCLWGAVDGINDAGLAVSLTFGGRKVVGDGFGIPLIVRYVLETCEDVSEASETLSRVPSHTAYNVTMVDRRGVAATAYLAPDRPTAIVRSPVSTNHQEQVEWEDYARVTSSVERREFLEARLADSSETRSGFISRFLQPPLYNTRFEQAFGTLYTAAYYPKELAVEYLWPHQSTLRQSFSEFREGEKVVDLNRRAGQTLGYAV